MKELNYDSYSYEFMYERLNECLDVEMKELKYEFIYEMKELSYEFIYENAWMCEFIHEMTMNL